MSRIGRMPVAIPAGVTVTVAEGNVVTVKGALGTLTKNLSPMMDIKVEGGHVHVTRPNDEAEMRALHGLTRALLHDMVVGVSEGYKKVLMIVGVGYKAVKQGNKLMLYLGHSLMPVTGLPQDKFIMEDTDTVKLEVPSEDEIKKQGIDKMTTDGTFDNFSKREKLQIARQRAKLEKNLGSIADLTRLPAALFVVDVQKESNAVKEAKRLNIPVFAMVDTCCDPTDIDYVIPANDDATKSIAVILDAVCGAISEGLEERKLEKEKEAQENEAHEGDAPAKKDAKPRIKKAVKASVDAEEAAVAEVVAATEQKAE